MRLTVISAVNNEQILKSCLLSSPDLRSCDVDVILQTGFEGAGTAYNQAMKNAKAEILAFVHQDMYLPRGWITDVQRAIVALSDHDPDWGPLGSWGVTKAGGHAGFLYWTGLDGAAGAQFHGGVEVETLDECVLIIRKSSGLSFDEDLQGFHMYGADICLEARRRGMKSYAISALSIHNTNEYKLLPWEFWKAYFYMRRKWKSQLPLRTTCTEITRYCWPMMRWNFVHTVNLALGRKRVRKRVPDPCLLYRFLSHSSPVCGDQ